MRILTSKLAIVVAAAVVPATPVLAQSMTVSTPITVGMHVTDTSGAPVGTVTGIQGDNLKVKTDKYETLLGRNSFTPSKGKLLLGMTQAQLDAEIEKSLAAADASVKVGALVKGPGGNQVGTIESVDSDWVTISVSDTQKLKLGRSGIRGNADGTTSIGLTSAQVQASLDQAASASKTAPSGSASE